MVDNVDRVLEQWRAERPDLDAAPMGVIGRISRAARCLERELQEIFDRHGLQTWEFDILATLRRSGRPYQLTAGGLVASAMVTSGAITNRIDRLVARGLVTRVTDPNNRRSVLITLTDQGLDLVNEAVERHVANEHRLLSVFTQAEQDELAGLLRTLLESLGDTPA
ncbi:MarR family transcriptional regulator [Phytoactinopolyspora alkaliphila]|uniref:MarR family transcriptional regulator n=1 Tax=Phytoactinopolyspora alkaliphila TaxID=1783498 RepID=A0A6N9YJC8_9ACTN|nr:MarR family transcriptional regulator [Phytoactinopolyspora alkaliphila]NED95116.1 MarR family transcriptional regulator [Phytoactinopolyspora alkaliphila]